MQYSYSTQFTSQLSGKHKKASQSCRGLQKVALVVVLVLMLFWKIPFWVPARCSDVEQSFSVETAVVWQRMCACNTACSAGASEHSASERT